MDEFAPEVYSQVLSATSSKEMEMRCVENKICGDGPKCSKSPAKSYLQDAPVKIDVSQFFSYMGSKTWSIAQLEILGFTKSLTLLIAMSMDVASFPYDRGKMDLDYFPSTLTCIQHTVALPIPSGFCQARLVHLSLPPWRVSQECCSHGFCFIAYGG